MNRERFYDEIRKKFGPLNQQQVDGFERYLDHFDSIPALLLNQASYTLATVWHETGRTMTPITEYGGRKYFDKYDTGRLAKALGNTPQKDGDGFLFRGRGDVQITGRANYDKLGERLGIDLVGNPDLALDPQIALRVAWIGMTEGLFTGKRLVDYLSAAKTDYFNARRVVNVLDRSKEIAGFAKIFEEALVNSL